MKTSIKILLISFITTFTSCDLVTKEFNDDQIQGDWYVTNIQGSYSFVNNAPQDVKDFVINYMYGDYLTFIYNDRLTFDYGNIYLTPLNGKNYTYGYSFIHKDELEIILDKSSLRFIADIDYNDATLIFNKTTLLDEIDRLYNISANKDKDYYNYMYDQVKRYVSYFETIYELDRNEPRKYDVVVGQFDGELKENGVLLDNNLIGVELYYNKSYGVYLQTGLSFDGSNNFVNLDVALSQMSDFDKNGYYNFSGSSRTVDPYYGSIYTTVKGWSYSGNEIEMDITVECGGSTFRYTFTNAYRNIETLYKSGRSSDAVTIKRNPSLSTLKFRKDK